MNVYNRNNILKLVMSILCFLLYILSVEGKLLLDISKLLEFDGNSKYISIPAKGLDVQNFSLCFWVNPFQTDTVENESILKGPCGNGFNYGYRIYMQNIAGNKSIIFEINFGNTSPRRFRLGTIPTGKFTHLAVTYNHEEVNFYLNGKIVEQKANKENRDINYQKNKAALLLGVCHFKKFKGVLTGIKLYDKALSLEAIAKLSKEKPVAKFSSPRPPNKIDGQKYYPQDKLHSPDFTLCRNLIQNPSFEAGLHYWSGKVQISNRIDEKNIYKLDNKEFRSGKRSLFIKGLKNEWRAVWAKTFSIPVKIGKDYTVSFYSKGSPGSYLSCQIWTGKWGEFPATKTVVLTDKWERCHFTFKVPNNLVSLVFFIKSRPPVDCHAWIDDIQFEKGDKLTEFTEKPLCAEFITDHFDNRFDVGEKMNARMVMHTKPEMSGTAQISVFNFFGKKLYTKNFSFFADKDGTASIPLPLEKVINLASGSYTVQADIELSSGFKDTDYFRFGFMRYLDNTHKHKNIFSLYDIFNFIPDPETAVRKFKERGIGSQCPFYTVPYKNLVKLTDKNNILMSTSVFRNGAVSISKGNGRYTPPEIRKEGMKIKRDLMNPANNADKIEENAYRVVKLNPHIKYWKLINEPWHDLHEDNAKMKRFMLFMRAASRGIKRANPEAKVISPDPTNMYPGLGIKEMENFIKEGLLEFCDIIAIHPYRPRPEHPDFDANTAQFIAMLDKYGYKGEIWFNEGIKYQPYRLARFGFDTTAHTTPGRTGPLSYDRGSGEKLQAAYIARSWLVALKYADRVRMCSDDLGSGIMDLNRNLYGAAWASNVLGNILGDADFVRDVDVSDKIRSYLFVDKEKRPIAVFWNIDKDVDDEKKEASLLTLTFAPNKVEFINFMGAKENLKNLENIPVGPFPFFIRGKSGTLDSFSKEILDLKVKGSRLTLLKPLIRVANDKTIEVSLLNQTTQKVKGNVEIVCSKYSVRKNIILESKEKLLFKIPLPQNITKGLTKINISLIFKPEDRGIIQKTTETFEVLYSRKAEKPIKIDGSLSDWPPNSVIAMPCRFKEFPVPAKLLKKYDKCPVWKGQDDLSAKLYTAWDKNFFYVALEVKDDKLVFPKKSKKAHLFDSLQLYFDTFADARDKEETGYDNNDYSYNIALVNKQISVFRSIVPEWQLCFLQRGFSNKVLGAFKKTKKGYIYELAFPVDEIRPISLRTGSSFGFALLVNENDGDYRKRGLTLTPTGTEPHKRPDLYPIIILKGDSK